MGGSIEEALKELKEGQIVSFIKQTNKNVACVLNTRETQIAQMHDNDKMWPVPEMSVMESLLREIPGQTSPVSAMLLPDSK